MPILTKIAIFCDFHDLEHILQNVRGSLIKRRGLFKNVCFKRGLSDKGG